MKYQSKLLTLVLLLSACTRSGPPSGPTPDSTPSQAHTPSVTGQPIDSSQLPQGGTQQVTLSNGAEITVQNIGGRVMYALDGAITSDSFSQIQSNISQKPLAERKLILKNEIDSIFKTLSGTGALAVDSVPSMGYFRFMLPYEPQLFTALKDLRFTRSITIEPILYQKNAIKTIKALSEDVNNGLVPRSNAASVDTSAYSGLKEIGAVDFVKRAQQDIGGNAQVNGSTVKVGVTDTGITYNHPTFLSADGKTNRIQYMKDTTGEGTIYINTAATFSATVPANSPDEDLMVNAQIISTPKLPQVPYGDQFTTVNGLRIKVNADLKQILLNPSSGAKLGILFENTLQGGEVGAVDLNHNGKLDDQLYMIYIPASNGSPERVYFDSSGTADFRGSPALQDFNVSHQTMPIFAEKMGFSFDTAQLPSQANNNNTVNVRSISYVGFDAGDHGSHVSGIIAGRKTIANDSNDTLARGVAPEAQIYLDRICSNNAGCTGNKALADLGDAGVDVINMSIGGLTTFNDGYGVQETLVNRLVGANNTALMISAGNDGPGRQTVASPSVARLSISVGAAASRSMIQGQYEWPGFSPSDGSDEFQLFFSSRGPTAAGGFKPNLSAPGSELSSLQLNAAAGSRGGLDVYWGTSMAAPTVTGSYALLLDAIHKYNAAHADKPLTTSALDIRRVLIESARPYDTAELSWIDEGTGMINLVAAWQKLFDLRDQSPATAVSQNGKSVELDYQIITNQTSANGIAYNGSRDSETGDPEFGTGLFLKANDDDQFKAIYINRELPEGLRSSTNAGDMTAQLETTSDEFVLRTVFNGAETDWLKAGVQSTLGDSQGCMDLPASNPMIIGEGTTIQTDASTGKGTLNPNIASVIYVCTDKAKVKALSPGDHGALIYAYRTANGKTSPVASFIIPVYMSVPNATLKGSTSYLINDAVPSFDVKKHYVLVPAGTSMLRITLQVPAYNGSCGGVQLMLNEGANTANPYNDNPVPARISNCTAAGTPVTDDSLRTLVVTQANPTAGLWDLHVFGQYRFKNSPYQLQVDYVTGEIDKKSITGNLSALSGEAHWKLDASSMAAVPDSAKSAFELTALMESTSSQVANGGAVNVENSLGVFRSYPSDVKSVTITTGQSPGNDIDLYVYECPAAATDVNDPSCTQKGVSNGPTDQETVTFTPVSGMRYVAQVLGSTVKDKGAFVTTESLQYTPEEGTVAISGSAPLFTASYSYNVAQSTILKNAFFTSGKRKAEGDLTLSLPDGTPLISIPVEISNQ